MQNDIKDTLKDTTLFNLIILLFILNAAFIINSGYVIVAAIGLLVGLFNLFMRAAMVIILFHHAPTAKLGLHLAGYVIRVVLTAVIGMLLFTMDKYYIFAYVGGFILHFFGVMLHGIKLMVLERK